MRVSLISICIFAVVAGAAIAANKIESGSVTAQSYVLYGHGPTGIVALKVDANGYLQTK